MVIVLGLDRWASAPTAASGRRGSAALLLVVVFAFGLSWVWTTLGLLLRIAERGDERRLHGALPAHLPQQHLRRPETLPGWLEAFVNVNPISHLVDGGTRPDGRTATVGQVGVVLVSAAALTAVFAPLTVHLYRRKN